MTWLILSVSWNIPGIFWDKHQQTSFPSKIFLFISDNQEISAVVHCYLSLYRNTKPQTDLLQIEGRWETPATSRHMRQDFCWAERAFWLLVDLFWLRANNIFLRTTHFYLFIIFLSYCTPAYHGYTKTSARWQRIQIEQIDRRFIQCVTCWHPATTQTPVSPLQRSQSPPQHMT